ncbi:hypothetical protein [Streptomyces marianii]|uniref:hypothetical protein n=1 Tax=Streptomyces marianii TaxID=1817406 RepID=UPI001487366C|nr:hypothetical protein [Streptomyces marianii]
MKNCTRLARMSRNSRSPATSSTSAVAAADHGTWGRVAWSPSINTSTAAIPASATEVPRGGEVGSG